MPFSNKDTALLYKISAVFLWKWWDSLAICRLFCYTIWRNRDVHPPPDCVPGERTYFSGKAAFFMNDTPSNALNPNAFSSSPPLSCFRRRIRVTATVFLAILCVLSACVAGTISFFRAYLTPELLYSCAGNMHVSALPLVSDADGKVYTFGEIVTASSAELGLH